MNCSLSFASELARCAATNPDKNTSFTCIHRLVKLAEGCTHLPVVDTMEDLLLSQTCAPARACNGLVNALGNLGNHPAQISLAKYLTTRDRAPHPPTLVGALINVNEPSHELLLALYARLVRLGHDGADGEVVARARTLLPNQAIDLGSESSPGLPGKHDSLPLGAAALASMASNEPGTAPEAVAAAELIHSAISRNLRRMTEKDVAMWGRVHNEASLEADRLWGKMNHNTRQGWAQHARQLNRKAFEWEIGSGRLGHHLVHSKRRLKEQVLTRHSEYDGNHEQQTEYQLIRALRSAHNSRAEQHVTAVASLLWHRSESVVDDAVAALKAFPIERAEAAVLGKLAATLRGTPNSTSSSHSVTVTRRALSTLEEWEGVGLHTVEHLVEHLLRLPQHLSTAREHGDSVTAACAAACAKECNPHQHTGSRRKA